MNEFTLIGRVFDDIKRERDEKDKVVYHIPLVVTRSYKNEEGIYESDFIWARAYGSVGESAAEYIRKGDIIGLRGRLENIYGVLTPIVTKTTFLASKGTVREENGVDTSEEI